VYPILLRFAPHFSRDVAAQFDAGQITTEAGAPLLRRVEQRTGVLRQFRSFRDNGERTSLVEHRVKELAPQRVYGIALGYEDLNDHDRLRQFAKHGGLWSARETI